MSEVLGYPLVYPLDTNVRFGDPDQTQYKGKITAVNIRKGRNTYEISFWKDCEKKRDLVI